MNTLYAEQPEHTHTLSNTLMGFGHRFAFTENSTRGKHYAMMVQGSIISLRLTYVAPYH